MFLLIDKLRKYFSAYGKVQDAVVMKDPVTKRSRGFGFITYADIDSVDNALAREPHTIDSRKVEAKRAVPRSDASKETVTPKSTTASTSKSHSTTQTTSSSVNIDALSQKAADGGHKNVLDPRATVNDYSFNKIFVGGLHYDTRDSDFRSYFEKFGRVITAEVMFNRETHKSRGFGFVVFEQERGAELVCEQEEHIIDAKVVEVKRAIPRSRIGGDSNESSSPAESAPPATKPAAKPAAVTKVSAVAKPAPSTGAKVTATSYAAALKAQSGPVSVDTTRETHDSVASNIDDLSVTVEGKQVLDTQTSPISELSPVHKQPPEPVVVMPSSAINPDIGSVISFQSPRHDSHDLSTSAGSSAWLTPSHTVPHSQESLPGLTFQHGGSPLENAPPVWNGKSEGLFPENSIFMFPSPTSNTALSGVDSLGLNKSLLPPPALQQQQQQQQQQHHFSQQQPLSPERQQYLEFLRQNQLSVSSSAALQNRAGPQSIPYGANSGLLGNSGSRGQTILGGNSGVSLLNNSSFGMQQLQLQQQQQQLQFQAHQQQQHLLFQQHQIQQQQQQLLIQQQRLRQQQEQQMKMQTSTQFGSVDAVPPGLAPLGVQTSSVPSLTAWADIVSKSLDPSLHQSSVLLGGGSRPPLSPSHAFPGSTRPGAPPLNYRSPMSSPRQADPNTSHLDAFRRPTSGSVSSLGSQNNSIHDQVGTEDSIFGFRDLNLDSKDFDPSRPYEWTSNRGGVGGGPGGAL